ncbi:MAG TPA: FAD-binding protein, partial [Pirellulales bacterium]
MTTTPVELSGWGNYPSQACAVFNPHQSQALREAFSTGGQTSYIPRGLGRAYGDSAVNDHAGVVLQTAFNRMLAFDETTGILECEAGVSFAEIIDCFLPRGWFLPTTPGTKFVTVGGAIAADV